MMKECVMTNRYKQDHRFSVNVTSRFLEKVLKQRTGMKDLMTKDRLKFYIHGHHTSILLPEQKKIVLRFSGTL